jgi:heme-degrading monooxygenase HmoA
MFARIGIWEGTAEELEKWIARGREQVKPSIAKDPGLKAVYWLADRDAGRGLIVTIWESEEAMNASEAARLKRQSGMAAATSAKVTTSRYEVVDSLFMQSNDGER